jgi:hypothetical protein
MHNKRRLLQVGLALLLLPLLALPLDGLSLPGVRSALAQSDEISFVGLIQAMDGATLVVNGLTVDVSAVTVNITYEVGLTVRVRGTLGADGRVIATVVEIVSVVPPAGDGGEDDGGNDDEQGDTPGMACPLGQGYWKNHADAWPAAGLSLGSQAYTQEELLALLNLPSGGDASLILAHQLIAARLSILAGADSAPVMDTLAQADAALAAFDGRLPLAVDPASDAGQGMVAAATMLDSYNNRFLTPACDRSDVPVAITIEGPVTQINVNVITIYNINIELAPDDPALTVIQVGDVIHVDGDIAEREGTIVIIAITIVFINVEVYINPEGTQIWRDNDNCQNAPPPWAPANGWRRRCDNGGGSGSRG